MYPRVHNIHTTTITSLNGFKITSKMTEKCFLSSCTFIWCIRVILYSIGSKSNPSCYWALNHLTIIIFQWPLFRTDTSFLGWQTKGKYYCIANFLENYQNCLNFQTQIGRIFVDFATSFGPLLNHNLTNFWPLLDLYWTIIWSLSQS